MIKIRITQKQMDSILQEGMNSRKILTENKEVVLGVALLLGVKLSGLNNELAHKYIVDDKVIGQIKNILGDEFKTKELIKNMEEKGMSDVKTLLTKKAEEVVKNFDKFCGPEKHDADANIKIINNLNNL